MSTSGLSFLWLVTWVVTVAIVLAWALRGPVNKLFGARVAYAVWGLVPATLIGLLLPARTQVLAMNQVSAHVEKGVHDSSGLTSAAFATIDVAGCLVGIWLAGFAWMLLRRYRAQRAFERDLGDVLPAGEPDVFVATGNPGLPAVVGLWKPRILLPPDFSTAHSAAEQALLLDHERSHVRAGDLWANALAEICCAALWFNPLVHLAAIRMRDDQELACDARVAEAQPGKRRLYAEMILKIQLVTSPAPLACQWRSVHPVKERIMQLKNAIPSESTRHTGQFFIAILFTGTACLAWAGQPARIVPTPVPAPAIAIAVAPEQVTTAEVSMAAADAAEVAGEAALTARQAAGKRQSGHEARRRAEEAKAAAGKSRAAARAAAEAAAQAEVAARNAADEATRMAADDADRAAREQARMADVAARRAASDSARTEQSEAERAANEASSSRKAAARRDAEAQAQHQREREMQRRAIEYHLEQLQRDEAQRAAVRVGASSYPKP